MSQEFKIKLQTSTREKIKRFNTLRGREPQPGEFWDVVVVTAVDQEQRQAYELQVKEKVERKEVPLGIHYKVFSDPPGCKIGNGGSTLYALQQLSEIYGEALGGMKVILIHAGGFSQRLPSASALGKIFTAMPLGDPLYQMLELKLAMYVDFPLHMKPGVLVTGADDIEIYTTADGDSIKFEKPGFTALAHPSPLSIGTTHGVFVFDLEEMSPDLEMENTSCLRFLHKPTISKMRENGAVCNRKSNCLSLSDAEFVYTDSTYYVDFDTVKSLLNLLEHLGPLNCEIDAYGDFLQALGPNATIDYTSNTVNVSKEENSLVEMRKKVFHFLRGTPLNVIVLNNSKFYHTGTTSEYLFHLTEDEVLQSELGFLSTAFSVSENSQGPSGCCIMYSVLDATSAVAARSVVEYCRLGAGVSIGSGSIVSSCWLSEGLSVPDGVFMHSLGVNTGQQVGFVTVVFGINDNLKRSVKDQGHADELKLFDLSLAECLSHWGLNGESVSFSDASSCTLWTACLFPVCPDPQSSFSLSLKMLHSALSGSTLTLDKDTKLMSMEEALRCKNLEEMLKFREGLYNDITQKK